MNQLSSSLLSLFVGLVCTYTATAQTPHWPDIKIASEGARPPYNYLDGNNELAGFEIDLARELCIRIKANCTFQVRDWDGMIPALLGGHFDAIMAAMEISDERRKKIAFSRPYVKMPSVFIAARKRMIRQSTVEGLKDRTIGVEAGGPHQAWLEDFYKQSTLRTYATLEEAILDLAEGRIDAVFGDKDAIVSFMHDRKEAQCCKLMSDVGRDPQYFGDGIGVGLRKQDTELKTLLDNAIDAVQADGTYARIRAKYFDFEIY